jgi:hypothetical protein
MHKRKTPDMPPKRAAERKAAERQRRHAAGLIRMDVWVRPELRERVKRYVEQLMRSA